MNQSPFFPDFVLVSLPEAVVEHLNLDAASRQRTGPQALERALRRPDEDPRISAGAEMPPLRHQLEVDDRLAGPSDADRFPRAVDDPVFPAPGVGIAIDIDEVILTEDLPARSRPVQECSGRRGGGSAIPRTRGNVIDASKRSPGWIRPKILIRIRGLRREQMPRKAS